MKTHYSLALILAAAVLVSLAGLTLADHSLGEEPLLIHLRVTTFDPLVALPDIPAHLQAGPLGEGRAPYIVQFTASAREEWKQSITARGGEIIGYIPDYAYLVRMTASTARQVEALEAVRWVGPFAPAYKIEPSLQKLALGSADVFTLHLMTFPGEDIATLEATISGLGGKVLAASEGEMASYLRLELPGVRIADLAHLPAVAWIEPFIPKTLHNNVARGIMNVNSAWTGAGVGLYGEGQIVAVADTGLDTGNAATIHEDIRGRLQDAYAWGRPGDWSDDVTYDGVPQGSHGTHVAGSVLGNGTLSGSNPGAHNYTNSFAGVAPEARLVFQSVMDAQGSLGGLPNDFNDLFLQAYNAGARIHTNSWGGPTSMDPSNPYGGYTIEDQQTDQFMWNHPDYLILFSAGNEGVDANADGVIDLDNVGSPGTAKNVVTVGATENNRPPGSGFGGYSNYMWGTGSWEPDYPVNPIHDDYISNNPNGMAAFSSRGPCDDGRIKPDVVAPGTDIISVRARVPGADTGWGEYNANYLYMGGTSMATPLTAGSAAIIRQWLQQVKGIANPQASLVKAVLLNGATNIAPGQYGTGQYQEIPYTIPNGVTGWGRVNVAESIGAGSATVLVEQRTDGLGTGGSHTYQYNIAVGAAPASGGQKVSSLPQSQALRQEGVTAVLDSSGITWPEPVRPTLAATGWTNIMTEDFEGAFPSAGWTVFDNDGSNYGEYFWAKRNCKPYQGNYSAWCVGGGANGSALACGADYPDYADSWMVYGPFDLSDATNAQLLFYHWTKTEYNWDYLVVMASLDGTNFYGDAFHGDWVGECGGWCAETFDLTDVYMLGNLCGQPRVWVAFNFESDYSVTYPGAFVDNIVLRAERGGVGPTPSITIPAGTSPTPSPTTTGAVSGVPFKVTLAWTDYPGSPWNSVQLVNDLDLEVIAPDGTHYYGNNASAGSRDRRNPVESVIIANPPSGNYQVIVRAHNVAMGGLQGYALAVSGPNLSAGQGLTPSPTATATSGPSATPTSTGTAEPSPTATRTVTVGPSLTPTSTRTPGAIQIFLPIILYYYPPFPATPSLNPIDNADGDNEYTVSWTTAARADTYTLQEDDNASFSSPTVVYEGSATSTHLTGKPTNKTLYYRVRSNNAWGTSGWSNTRSVWIPPAMGTWRIINDTGGTLTIELYGVQTREFAPGTHDWQLAPGTYSYRASASCGSLTSSVRIYEYSVTTTRFYCAYYSPPERGLRAR
ncbi:MAG: S8 family serine peptidase [Chloroflexi bacterium]|nr:S8 family serine peptidase [Chloroflexota bacterium]